MQTNGICIAIDMGCISCHGGISYISRYTNGTDGHFRFLDIGQIYLWVNGDQSVDGTEIEKVTSFRRIIGIAEKMIVGQTVFFGKIGKEQGVPVQSGNTIIGSHP